MKLLLWLGTLAACSGTQDRVDTEDTSEAMSPLFSFAVIADPHISNTPDHEARLEEAVNWINQQDPPIALVLLVGDVGWGTAGLGRAREILDALAPPYVPLIGDNEVHAGEEALFQETFASQHEALSTTLETWEKAPNPAWHPELEEEVYLQNLSFEHKGVRFIGLDLAVRGVSGSLGELGNLNDYPGGTWPWLEAALEDANERRRGSIVLASHIPLMLGAFDLEGLGRVEATLMPHQDQLHADYAGHLHIDYSEQEHGFELHVIDALWDDEKTLRVVEVSGNSESIAYTQVPVILP